MQRLWKVIYLIAMKSPDQAIMQTVQEGRNNQPIKQTFWNDPGFKFIEITHHGLDMQGMSHSHPALI
jgi:hypothetical protein